jgi:Do/DeqQ family serine protease
MYSSDSNLGRRPQGRTAFRTRMGAAAGALLLTGSLIGWTAAGTGAGKVAAAPERPVAALTAPAAGRTIGAGGDSYAPIVEQTAPAVVTIRSDRTVKNVGQQFQLPDDPLFRQFFGERFGNGQGPRQMPPQREGGLGSGVIVRADGYILTNNHVVEGADHVTVEMTDGQTFKAKVVGTDAPSDLAVVKIDGKNLQTLPLGNSDNVRTGDVVLAVGNPLGVGQTVTMGIVSAKGRATGGAGDGSFEDFIQTDAPINRGNSGGALINTRGELIGINSQILSPSGGNIGIGFAIPANMARNVMTQLIDKGGVRRGMLGVTIQPVTSDIARSLGLSQAHGALVSSVQSGSPADKGGIRRGDVITAIDGTAVSDTNVLRNRVSQLLPGTSTKVTLVRDGKEQTANVTLAELKAANKADSSSEPSADGTGYGLALEPLTPQVARQLGVEASAGVVIREVQPAGRAADAGLRSGDVIEQVDGKTVDSVDALRAALKKTDKPALLLVHRGAASMFVTLDRE